MTSSFFPNQTEQQSNRHSESVSSASIIPSLVIEGPKAIPQHSPALECPQPPLSTVPCPPLRDGDFSSNNAALSSMSNGKQQQQVPSITSSMSASITQPGTQFSSQSATQPPPPQRADTIAEVSSAPAAPGQKRTSRRNPHISTLRDRSLPVNHDFNTSFNVASAPPDGPNTCGAAGGAVSAAVGVSSGGSGSGLVGPLGVGVGAGGSALGSNFHFGRLEPIGEISTPNHAVTAPPAFRGDGDANLIGEQLPQGSSQSFQAGSAAASRAESRGASFFMESFQSQHGGHPSLGYRDSYPYQDSIASQQTSQIHSPIGYQQSLQSQQSLNTVFGGPPAVPGMNTPNNSSSASASASTSVSALPHQPFSSAATIQVPVRVAVPMLTKNVSLPERDSPRSHGHGGSGSANDKCFASSGSGSATVTGRQSPRRPPQTSSSAQRFEAPAEPQMQFPKPPPPPSPQPILPAQHARHTSVVVPPSSGFSSTSRLEVGAAGRLGTVSGSPRIPSDRERGPNGGGAGLSRSGYVRRSSSANRINEKDPFAKIGLQLLKVTGGMGFRHLRDVRALSNVSRDSLGGGGGSATAGEERRRHGSQSSKKDSLSLRAPTAKLSGSNLTAISALSASTQMLVSPLAHMAAVDVKPGVSPLVPAKSDSQTPFATPRKKTRSNSCKTRRGDSRRSDRSVPARERSSDFRVLIDGADSEHPLPHPQVIPPSPTPSPVHTGRLFGGGSSFMQSVRQRCDTVPASVCDMESVSNVTSPLLSCSVRGLEESGNLLSPTGAGHPTAASSTHTMTRCACHRPNKFFRAYH